MRILPLPFSIVLGHIISSHVLFLQAMVIGMAIGRFCSPKSRKKTTLPSRALSQNESIEKASLKFSPPSVSYCFRAQG